MDEVFAQDDDIALRRPIRPLLELSSAVSADDECVCVVRVSGTP